MQDLQFRHQNLYEKMVKYLHFIIYQKSFKNYIFICLNFDKKKLKVYKIQQYYDRICISETF